MSSAPSAATTTGILGTDSSIIIIDPLEVLANDVGSLWVPQGWKIPILDQPPTSLHFLREFVSLSRPCIIRNAIPSLLLLSASPQNGLTTKKNHLLTHDIFQVLHGGREGVADSNAPDGCSPIRHMTMTVAVTPDGFGDCLRSVSSPMGMVFVEPMEEEMTLQALATKLAECQPAVSAEEAAATVFPISNGEDVDSTHKYVLEGDDDDGSLYQWLDRRKEIHTDGIYYYSRQNDCLRGELPNLWQELHLPDTFPWAEEAFGTGPPEAVNLWVGNHRAVSSMHKDHYENLFLVLSGEKVFTLCPPSDIPFLYERPYPRGQFRRTNDNTGWTVQMVDASSADDDKEGLTNTTVQWITADVTRRNDPSYQCQFPLLRHAHPVTVNVQPGDLLYLPSLWFHRVTQTETTVAVNYWYDMRFDSPQWCYFHYLQTQASDK